MINVEMTNLLTIEYPKFSYKMYFTLIEGI